METAAAPKAPQEVVPSGPDNESPEAAAARAVAERRLWWWNFSCALLHLVQAAVVLGIGECGGTQGTAGRTRHPR